MGKKSSPPPPDYKPMADASAESARLSAELGQKQLDENKRQYEENKAVQAPILAKQLEMMDQSKTQGDAYFDNWKQGQAVTDLLKNDALKDTTERDTAERNAVAQSMRESAAGYNQVGDEGFAYGKNMRNQINSEQGAIASQLLAESNLAAKGINDTFDKYGTKTQDAIDLYAGGDNALRAKYGADIEDTVGRSVSDTRVGQSQATNQAMRQAMRYGISMPDSMQSTSLKQAQDLAASANGSRVMATDKAREVVGNTVGMQQNILNSSTQASTASAGISAAAIQAGAAMRSNGAMSGANAEMAAKNQQLNLKLGAIDKVGSISSVNRDLRRQDDATTLAKRLDVSGLYNGMTGASAGAYGMANSSGNSAMAGQTGTSGQYLSGMNSGINTIMGGRQLAQGGLGSILNAQTAVATTGGGSTTGGMLGGLGGLMAGGAEAYKAYASKREYKTDIVYVGMHEIGVPIYDFSYRPEYADKWGHGRHRGVMIDELEQVMPEAISVDADGHSVVNYSMLGGMMQP